MDESQNQFDSSGMTQKSDNDDDSISSFLPYLSKDLWELGSAPAYKYELLDKNRLTKDKPSIIDFGCGKGAELIQLSDKFEFDGTGIDIVEGYIEEANFRKRLNHCEHLNFIVDDFIKNIDKYKNFDVLIFNYQNDFFGSLDKTLSTLVNVVKKNKGYILLDTTSLKYGSKNAANTSYDTYSNIKSQISASGLEKIGYIYWDKNYISRMYSFSLNCIQRRAEELITQQPNKTALFQSYLDKKKSEAALMCNDLECITWLLKNK